MKNITMKALFVLTLIPFMLFGQKTETDVKNFLNQGSSKTWMHEGTITVMKGSNKCVGGGYYDFKENNRVIIAMCVNNQWEIKELKYSIRQDTPVDWYITIGDQEFYLVMTETSTFHRIRLRTTIGDSKTDPSYDITLKYYIDD